MSKYIRIEEDVIPGMRLGRHVNHDPRSFGFEFQAMPRKLTNVLWPRSTPILDQGNLGSCTGNAMTGALATGPVFTGLPARYPALDEAEAVHLYSQATVLDPYPGTYPPTDTGSDGVSVAQAASNAYLVAGYTHTFDLATALQAIMTGPVIIGLNWYSSFDNPGADGRVSITSNAYVRGGHEVLVRGLSADNSELLLDNSWSSDWGNEGSFIFSFDTFERLLSEDGDCTVPTPAMSPKPVPVPVIVTANGTQSLLGLSQAKGAPVSTILKNTVSQYKAYSHGMSAYLQHGALSLPMPPGEKLCLAWPQYHIS